MSEPNQQAENKTAKILALSLIALCVIAIILGIYNVTVSSHSQAKGIESHNVGGEKLAYIPLEGMIMEEIDQNNLWEQESSAVSARRLLYAAAEDKNVKGVLLRINSPGGTVGMSQELYEAVSAVREKKPVVVSMGDVAASGGYYTAAAADKIVANPGTLTASIGVIISSMNFEKLMNDKLGVHDVTIKSGRYKDILSPYRQPTSDEVTLVQNIINTSYKQFLKAVLDGRTRGMSGPAKTTREAAITAIADGRVVTGSQAVEIGLVDKLGGLEDAKVMLQKMAGEKFDIKPDKLPLERYQESFSLWDMLSKGGMFQFKVQTSSPWPDVLTNTATRARFANQPLWMMEGL